MKKILIVLLACLTLSSCSVLFDTTPGHDVIYYRYDYPYSSTRYYYRYRTIPTRHHHHQNHGDRYRSHHHHQNHGDRYQPQRPSHQRPSPPQRNHRSTSTGSRR